MKCPKCNYITFDHLEVCPRCGKDLTEEKTRCNIFFVNPNTPFFLESLIGNIDGSAAVDSRLNRGVQGGAGIKDKIVYDDGSELDINLDLENSEFDMELDEDDH